MKENKNIERLFQEKFKDFEVTPLDLVWDNIKDKLHPEEKKRRIIPLWFKVGSIAASLTLLFSLFYLTNNNENENNFRTINSNTKIQQTVDKNNSAKNINSTSTKNTTQTATSYNTNPTKTNIHQSELDVTKDNYVSNTDKKSTLKTNYQQEKIYSQPNTNSNSTDGLVNNQKTNNRSKKTTNRIFDNQKEINNTSNYVSTTKKNKVKRTIKNSDIKQFDFDSRSVIADNNTKKYSNKKKNRKASKTNENEVLNFDTNTSLTENDANLLNNKKKRFKNRTSNKQTNKNLFEDVPEFNSTTVVDNLKNNTSKTSKSKETNLNSLNADSKSENLTTISSKDVIADLNLNDSNSLIGNNNNKENINTLSSSVVTDVLAKDTLPLVNVDQAENPLEKLLKEKEDNKKIADEKEKTSKWAVNSFVAPVYFNSFTEGSPISDDFVSNSKSYNNSLSYGIGISYQLTKKLALKAGVNNLSLDYDTYDVAYYSSYKDQTVSDINVERNQKSKYLVIENHNQMKNNTTVELLDDEFLVTGENEGSLNQKMQYVEVPLELSYALLNKKFGITVRGGLSTLFLTENVVSIQTNMERLEVGKANNLSNVHFSTNLGLGFNYNFFKNFQLNLEPMLKYQINAFTTNSGNFKPYIVGISTGLSFKF